MQRVFDIAWLAALAFIAGSWPWLPATVGEAHGAVPRDDYLAFTLALVVLVPWLATRGALWIARRAPQLVNLPHREHWLAPVRLEATLADLRERLAWLGLGLLLLHAGLHYQALQHAQPGWPQVPAWGWPLGGFALGVALAVWSVALWRRYVRLPAVTTPRAERRHSRSRDLVWREAQPIWSLLVAVPVAALLAALAGAAAHPAGWVLPLVVVAALLGFSRLVTEVHGDRIVWRFGWLPWPRWQLDLDDIAKVEPASTRWMDGWGMRVTREGMLYNASGKQAVRLVLRDGRRLRLGSQEPHRLMQALQGRIGG
ncbi:MAG: hypothetical protein EOP39_02265 [Rubrivivax sp.]|nr:MAG: hypothetical protein EOP39_02265 [Rubrivivax sp.]